MATLQQQFKQALGCPSSLQCDLLGLRLCKALGEMPHQDLREDSQAVEQDLDEGSVRPEASQPCLNPHRDQRNVNWKVVL